jgi:hypothetical protein
VLHNRSKHAIWLTICAAMLALAPTASADPITLSDVATGFNSPIGVDYHAPTNSLILSANYPTGAGHNFELVDTNGTHTQFSTVSGLGDEIYIAAARTTANGFTAGETFTGNGNAGGVLKMSPDGTSVTTTWVDLAAGFGETGLLRGALHIDTTGVFGGDLIVGTTAGNVYRITSGGVATFLANVGSNVEGLVTVPNDVARYGAWAGKILGGSDAGNLYTIDTAGHVTTYNSGTDAGLPFDSTENLNIPNAGETFYGVDFAQSKLQGADSSQWVPYVGDVIMGEENGKLWDIKWNGTAFVSTLLTTTGQWEGATFAPTTLPGIPGVPEPSSLILFGTVLGGLALTRLRRGKQA